MFWAVKIQFMKTSSWFSPEVMQLADEVVHHENTSCMEGDHVEKIITDTARTISLCANNARGWKRQDGNVVP